MMELYLHSPMRLHGVVLIIKHFYCFSMLSCPWYREYFLKYVRYSVYVANMRNHFCQSGLPRKVVYMYVYVFVGAGFPMHCNLIWSIVRPL
jgi:hypothetical protein